MRRIGLLGQLPARRSGAARRPPRDDPLVEGGAAAAGIVGACGLFSATLLASSRIPFVLSEDGYMPKAITRIHPKYGTPAAAILVSAAIYTALSFQTFKALTALDVVMYSAGVLLELAALVVLRVRAPELERPYRVPGGWPMLILVGLLPLLLVSFGVYSQFHDPEDGGPRFLILSAMGLLSGPAVYAIRRKATTRRKSRPQEP